MDGVAPPTTFLADPHPGTIRRGFLGAARRRLTAPFRFARRRPLRALLWSVVGLALVAAAAAGGTYLWFRHHLEAARTAVGLGHNAEAARHLRSCQRVASDNRQVLLLIARVARRSGEWEQAEQFLDEYWSRYGDDDASVAERLMLRANRGDVDGAGPSLTARISAGDPDATACREALVGGYISRFRWSEAAGALDDWRAREPDNTFALLLWGKLQEQRLALDDAKAAYQRVVELDPDHDEARLRLTTLLLQRFRGEEALAHLPRLRERLPDNPEVAYQWAVALGLQGRTDEARAALEECLRRFPHFASALALRGRYAALDGDDAAAVEYLSRAVEAEPGNLVARHQYVQALVRTGQAAAAAREEADTEAIATDLERMRELIAGPLQANPNDPAIHHQIAVVALHAGQPVEALRWLQSALQVDPDHLPTHQTLTGYYYATGNPVLAARHRAIVKKLEAREAAPTAPPGAHP